MAMTNRAALFLTIVAVLLVLMPFLVWERTWFGRRLSDRDMETYLRDNAHPRRMQHALAQMSARIERSDSAAKQWYPQIVALSGHSNAKIRTTAAWVMGQDNGAEVFHRSLVGLLKDSDVLVRRNAALALVRFGDLSGRAELVKTLQSVNADSDQVWEALRGLYFAGEAEDLPEVERYERGVRDTPKHVREQATLTARAIRTRSERKASR